jgi:hypothetical protein
MRRVVRNKTLTLLVMSCLALGGCTLGNVRYELEVHEGLPFLCYYVENGAGAACGPMFGVTEDEPLPNP